jgi:hypothetical protein
MSLEKFLTVAKAAVYDDERAQMFLPMLDTQSGAVQAVMQVVAAIESKQPIDPQIKPMLAVHIYLMMVDVAMTATGEKPDKAVMQQTTQVLLKAAGGA